MTLSEYLFLGNFFPHTLGAPLKPQFGNIKWNDDDKYFQLWCEGRTGFPVIDAAMTELNTTGKIRFQIIGSLQIAPIIHFLKSQTYFQVI